MSTKEIINAALVWHAAHERRRAIGAEKRRLEKALKDDPRELFATLGPRAAAADAGRRLTPAKQRELNALRALARACIEHRTTLEQSDVVDVEVKQLAVASTTSTTTERT